MQENIDRKIARVQLSEQKHSYLPVIRVCVWRITQKKKKFLILQKLEGRGYRNSYVITQTTCNDENYKITLHS